MLLVAACVDRLFCDSVGLGSQNLEIGVLKDFLWVLHLGYSLRGTLFLVGLLFEHDSFDGKLTLKLYGLGVETVIESHLFGRLVNYHIPRAHALKIAVFLNGRTC